jgi:hypothetical protein
MHTYGFNLMVGDMQWQTGGLGNGKKLVNFI